MPIKLVFADVSACRNARTSQWQGQQIASPTLRPIHPDMLWSPPSAGMCALAGAAVCSSMGWRGRVAPGRCKPRTARCQAVSGRRAMSSSSLGSSVLLNDGNAMPAMGLGTAMPPQQTYEAVRSALDLGYRFVDTAQNYRNEEFVGKAVRDFLTSSGIDRKEVFVSTKFSAVQTRERRFEAVLQAGRESCKALGLDYIDRVLLHSPHGGKLVEAYDALLELQSEGVVRSVGVSNFAEEHLETLQFYERPPPVVNQIEMHPLLFKERSALVEKCQCAGIPVEAFCPLLRGSPEFLMYGTLPELASLKGRTPAQVLIRWALQKGFIVVPRSAQMVRQEENTRVFDFELSADEMQQLEDMTGFGGQSSLVLYPEALTASVDVGRVSARDMYVEENSGPFQALNNFWSNFDTWVPGQEKT